MKNSSLLLDQFFLLFNENLAKIYISLLVIRKVVKNILYFGLDNNTNCLLFLILFQILPYINSLSMIFYVNPL